MGGFGQHWFPTDGVGDTLGQKEVAMSATLEGLSTMENQGDDNEVGRAYERRRLAHGFKSVRELAQKSGISREAITKVEAGTGTDYTRGRLDAFFDSWEEETGSDYADAQSATAGEFKIELAGVYGIEDITFSGPMDRSQEIVDRAVEFMRGVREPFSEE